MKPEFPIVGDLAADGLALAKVAARNSLLPHPDVVAQIPGGIWPCIRANQKLGERGLVVTFDGNLVLLDDNTVSRWALLVAHGFGPNLPYNRRGWSIAHVWPKPRCRHSYTALANLAMIAEPLAGLTDKSGPVGPYLRYHSWSQYRWKPPGQAVPAEPAGYGEVEWHYFSAVRDSSTRLATFLAESNNAWAKQLVSITHQTGEALVGVGHFKL